jgi:hypothetical protein
MLKSARLQHGDVYDFFPRSHVFTQHSKDILIKHFDQPGRLWIGKPAASSQGRGIHLTTTLKDFANILAPLRIPSSSAVVNESEKNGANIETPTVKQREVIIVRFL